MNRLTPNSNHAVKVMRNSLFKNMFFVFIFLTLFSPLSPLVANEACHTLFATGFVEKIDFPDTPDPEFHFFNADKIFGNVGEEFKLERYEYDRIGLVLHRNYTVWQSRWLEPESLVEFIGINGMRVLARVKKTDPSEVGTSTTEDPQYRAITFLRLNVDNFDQWRTPPKSGWKFTPPLLRFQLQDKDLALRLARNQSFLFKPPTNLESDPFFASFVTTNQKMIEILQSGKSISMGDLKALHQEIYFPKSFGLRVPQDFYDFEAASGKIAGIVRGTREIVDRGGGAQDIDLRHLNLAFHDAAAPPAREVPIRLEALLERINTIEPGTTFLTIVAIYKEYILLQPFANGNRRMAAILLDYCLMRAGFSPLPRQTYKTRNPAFKSVVEMAEDLADVYLDLG